MAFFAYASYLGHGRGAVAFQLGNPRCHYVTYAAGEAVPADLQAALAGYNPQTQLICHFQDAAMTPTPTAAAVLVSEVANREKWPKTVYDSYPYSNQMGPKRQAGKVKQRGRGRR